MMREPDALNVLLIGFAAVGGLMSGTCLAIRKTLKDKKAKLALWFGYGFVGLTFGLVGLALEPFIGFMEVESYQGAFLVGVLFATVGVTIIGAVNIGSVITLRYLGLQVTIAPMQDDSDEEDEK